MVTAISEPSAAARRPDVFYLYAARAARGIGDGFAFIILPAYLSELGFNPFQIGVVATSALLGTAATTLAVGFLAARFDLRNLLLIGAAVMVLTGLAVANSHALAAILIIVFLGSLNPSTGDLGMIVPLEHAMLARGAQDADRT
jgi:MFS family permease